MLSHKNFAQRGVSLIEMMIGLLVGAIVVSAVIAIYITTLRGGNNTLRTARLNQDLRAAMDVMVRDVRRAGYNGWTPAGTVTLTTDNDFAKRVAGGLQTDLRIYTLANTGDCILYTYDAVFRDGNVSGTVDASDYFGFKLAADGRLMMRTSGSNTTNCNDGNWEAITDSAAVVVTTLRFSTPGSQCLNFKSSPTVAWKTNAAADQKNPPIMSACDVPGADIKAGGIASLVGDATVYAKPATGDLLLETRQIIIELVGQAAGDADIKTSLRETVQVRNDRLVTAP